MEAAEVTEMDIITAGGLCIAADEERLAKKSSIRWKFAAVYIVANFVFNFVDAVSEGILLERCSSAIADLPDDTRSATQVGDDTSNATQVRSSTNYLHYRVTTPMLNPNASLSFGVPEGLGLDIWKVAFFLLVVVVLPLELWLLTNSIWGTKLFTFTCRDAKHWLANVNVTTKHAIIQDPYCLCYKTDTEKKQLILVDGSVKPTVCKWHGNCSRCLKTSCT